jgi:DNA helicase IV
VAVTTRPDADEAAADLQSRWQNVAVIRAGEVWIHKGVEYDGVVVVRSGMSPRDEYLAASRAAHELILVE